MLEKVKTALRVTHNALDDEITGLIAACKKELSLAGIKAIDDSDPLIIRAVILYAKTNFGYDNPDSVKFLLAYDNLKCSLAFSPDYNGGNWK